MNVPCGYCSECLNRKRREWTFRNEQQLRKSGTGHFVTFTYEDENLPRNDLGWATLNKPDVQNFLKRLRKNLPDKEIKYFIVGEYGPKTLRPHYHGLLYGLDAQTYYKDVEKAWSLQGKPIGNTHFAQINQATIMYCAKYHLKGKVADRYTPELELTPEFTLVSKGLGLEFLQDKVVDYVEQLNSKIIPWNEEKIKLPKYYTDKIEKFLRKEDPAKFVQWKANVHSELVQYAEKRKTEFLSEKDRIEYIVNQDNQLQRSLIRNQSL